MIKYDTQYSRNTNIEEIMEVTEEIKLSNYNNSYYKIIIIILIKYCKIADVRGESVSYNIEDVEGSAWGIVSE